MPPRDCAGQDCPVARSREVVGDRRPPLIVREALTGVPRSERVRQGIRLAPDIPGTRLRALTDAGIHARQHHHERSESYGFVLTPGGRVLTRW